ncbi:mechanosensitive ion channel family protein [Oceanospirillum sediminis]|uniref:Mechanosensitive ion channel n=1 Tax=Oceanospirillum sediminis TaxID=2760088 RepID=A0A839ISB5_9GAMM|nr:mechanosensitive ion channel domain-containing protein [Oceanospirillum sediminis]MBB1487868.1 mechanosensitive ion channel [Oceanospirillum sediminis]
MDKEIIWLTVHDNKWLASFLVLILFLMLRWSCVRLIKKFRKGDDIDPKRWINVVNNLTSLFTIIALIVIWLSELRFIALSIAAFAVALVVATREQIQSFLGALYIAGSRAFAVGDWIQIGTVHGEVVSSDWLTTTLLEVDLEGKSYGYTGRTVVIPNHHFSTTAVRNLNFMRRYITHSFELVREADPIDIRAARQFLMQRIEFYSSPFRQVAERYGALIEKKLGVELNMNEYGVRVCTNSTAKNVFMISFFCPTPEAVAIEQKITEDFMAYWYKQTRNYQSPESKHKDGDYDRTEPGDQSKDASSD